MTSEQAAGRIVRVELSFEQGFTMLPNRWVRDPRLTYRARGILAVLMSHESGAHVSIESLVENTAKRNERSKAHEGRDAVRAAIAELEQYGYLHRPRRRVSGRYVVDWYLQEPPQELENLWITTPHRVGSTATAQPTRHPHRVGSTASAEPTDKKTKQEEINTYLGNQQSDEAEPVDNSVDPDRCNWDRWTRSARHYAPKGIRYADGFTCTRCGTHVPATPRLSEITT